MMGALNAFLKEKFPISELKILSRSKTDNTFFNESDRRRCEITGNDITKLNNNPDKKAISGDNNIYLPYKNSYVVIKDIHPKYHSSVLLFIEPLIQTFSRRVIDIQKINEDPLTHAYSKAYYDAHGKDLDKDKAISYSIVAIDLDKFKKINDTY
jgi:hypothetical protein